MSLVSRALMVVFATAGVGLYAERAVAQQDSVSQQFDDIRTMLGLGKYRPPIDFTERAPIVVPPSYTLPPPGHGDPDQLDVKDPDVAARRKALTDPRRPVPPTDPGAAATGRSARAYLIDPPSGLRDPDAVAATITHGAPAPAAAPTRHARARKKKLKQAAE